MYSVLKRLFTNLTIETEVIAHLMPSCTIPLVDHAVYSCSGTDHAAAMTMTSHHDVGRLDLI